MDIKRKAIICLQDNPIEVFKSRYLLSEYGRKVLKNKYYITEDNLNKQMSNYIVARFHMHALVKKLKKYQTEDKNVGKIKRLFTRVCTNYETMCSKLLDNDMDIKRMQKFHDIMMNNVELGDVYDNKHRAKIGVLNITIPSEEDLEFLVRVDHKLKNVVSEISK